jgi:cytochrome P450 family 6
LEKGILTIIPVLGLHHDPKYYPDPERFDPERFSKEEIEKRHHYVYLPFGEGPRICIGKCILTKYYFPRSCNES